MDPPAALTEREITGYLLKKKQKNSSFISYYVFILSFVPCSWASVGQMIHRAHFWVIFGRFIDLNIAFLSTSFPPRLYFPSLLLFAFQMWTVNSGEVTSGRRGLWYLLPANVNLSQHLWVGIKLRVCVCVCVFNHNLSRSYVFLRSRVYIFVRICIFQFCVRHDERLVSTGEY